MGVSLLSHCLMTWMLWGYPHFRKPLFGGFFKFIGDLVGDEDTHTQDHGTGGLSMNGNGIHMS